MHAWEWIVRKATKHGILPRVLLPGIVRPAARGIFVFFSSSAPRADQWARLMCQIFTSPPVSPRGLSPHSAQKCVCLCAGTHTNGAVRGNVTKKKGFPSPAPHFEGVQYDDQQAKLPPSCCDKGTDRRWDRRRARPDVSGRERADSTSRSQRHDLPPEACMHVLARSNMW